MIITKDKIIFTDTIKDVEVRFSYNTTTKEFTTALTQNPNHNIPVVEIHRVFLAFREFCWASTTEAIFLQWESIRSRT